MHIPPSVLGPYALNLSLTSLQRPTSAGTWFNFLHTTRHFLRSLNILSVSCVYKTPPTLTQCPTIHPWLHLSLTVAGGPLEKPSVSMSSPTSHCGPALLLPPYWVGLYQAYLWPPCVPCTKGALALSLLSYLVTFVTTESSFHVEAVSYLGSHKPTSRHGLLPGFFAVSPSSAWLSNIIELIVSSSLFIQHVFSEPPLLVLLLTSICCWFPNLYPPHPFTQQPAYFSHTDLNPSLHPTHSSVCSHCS